MGVVGRVKPGSQDCPRVPKCPTIPMLLWMMSTPFEGIFGSEDSGQTNDGPLVGEGKLLSGHASSRSVGPDHGPANRAQVSPVDDRRTVSQVHGPGI